MRLVMSPRAPSTLVLASVGAILVPGAALAQTTGASITQGQQTAPDRFLNFGQANQEDLGTATRSEGFNPTGVNYADCVSDMTLGFPVILNGFGVGTNNDAMQIWATALGDCTFDADRGIGNAASCWLVNSGFAAGTPANNVSQEFYVRVQDLVGPQQAPPNPPTGVVHEGASACSAQPSYAAVPITVWFVPLTSQGTFDSTATALSWTVGTDLVGPPAPQGLTVGAGQNLLIPQWTANTDSDTTGYNVFIDPPPASAQMAPTTEVVCPPSSSSSSASNSTTSGSSEEDADVGSADATSEQSVDIVDVTSEESADAADATVSSSSSPSTESSAGPESSASSSSVSSGSSNAADAGCHTVNIVEVPPSANNCSSAVLGSAMPADSGAASVEAEAGEDGGVQGVGGIATIPCQYAINVGCPAGSPIYTETAQSTVSGETTTSTQITGLSDGVTYAVAVSAVDSFGNPGPATAPMCNFPAPIVDFFDIYRDAGGQAGGGFCALRGGTRLEASSDSPIGSWIAFGTAGVAALAVGRRRRGRTR